MDHVAIMNRSLFSLEKIISGEKRIESRWFKYRKAPWGLVSVDDTLYFKNSGEQVKIKAQVDKVIQFDELAGEDVECILKKYGKNIGLEAGQLNEFHEKVKDKRYCVLMFLTNIEKVEPFSIDKSGYGSMTAWITVKNISEIKID